MKHIWKALIDTIIVGGTMVIFAILEEISASRALIPMTAVALYFFIKGAFGIYIERRNQSLK